MRVASTFLSHSSADKPLVEAVARELGRRGVVTWLDEDELGLGADLVRALDRAVQGQLTLTAFLSEKSVKSSWVEDELATAIEKQEELGKEIILPVFLGDALKLAQNHPLLRSRWLHADGDRVKIKYIEAASPADLADVAAKIADEAAAEIYQRMQFKQAREVIICLDQRGEGLRSTEPPPLPQNIVDLEAPALVFRPDRGFRSASETLHGDEWELVSRTLRDSLARAMAGPRWVGGKKIRLCGDAQLGLFFAVGKYFDRSGNASLYCYNSKFDQTFNNHGQPRHEPLAGGDPHCEVTRPDLPPLAPQSRQEAVALLLSTEAYVAPARKFLATRGDLPPLVWVPSGMFETSEQAMKYVADVVALLKRLRAEYETNTLYLFCGLPNHVVPLLAANLLHVIENVVFMEHRRDLQGKNPQPEETYVELRF